MNIYPKQNRYQFTTNETNEMHTISGYSVFDAMNMLELAGYTVKSYIGMQVEKCFTGYGFRWVNI